MHKHFLEMKNRQILYSNIKLLVIYFTKYLSKLTEEKYPYLKEYACILE